jgi:hypothetical protein
LTRVRHLGRGACASGGGEGCCFFSLSSAST